MEVKIVHNFIRNKRSDTTQLYTLQLYTINCIEIDKNWKIPGIVTKEMHSICRKWYLKFGKIELIFSQWIKKNKGTWKLNGVVKNITIVLYVYEEVITYY